MKIAFLFNLKRTAAIEEAEFDPPEVVETIFNALGSSGDQVTKIEMTRDGRWIKELQDLNPDLVFNTAEGFCGIGREALAPTALEQLQLRYVGSGPFSCFLTLDKYLTKKVVADWGVDTPESYFISDLSLIETIANELPYPVFVKPNFEGSSKGITQRSRCNNKAELTSYAKDCLHDFSDGIIIERYIEGKDITVPFIDGLGPNQGVLEPVEYTGTQRGDSNIYDYDMKNIDDRNIGVKCPADISDQVKAKVTEQTKILTSALGICDMCRADFRVTSNGDVYFIEVNALPSFQPDAGLFMASGQLGLDYKQTIQSILQSAIKRNKLKSSGVAKARKLTNKQPTLALVFNMKKKSPGDEGYEEEAEFDSPQTIEAIACALRDNGFKPIMIEADRDLAKNLMTHGIDVVFNIAEGLNKQSREAQVPALCDLLGIEHTGSDAACLSITLNKALSTKLVLSENLKAPRSVVFHSKRKKYKHNLKYPLIIKPNLEGTSKGIYNDSVVENNEELEHKLEDLFTKFHGPMLCEEFIIGREFTVGLIGDSNPQVIGITEIKFKSNGLKYPIYSYEAKQEANPLNNDIYELICPAQVSPKLYKNLITVSKNIFKLTGCRDVARIDYRVADNDDIYFIEINPLPGLSPGFSDLSILAEKNGITYTQLISKIAGPAIRRWRKNS